VREIVISIDGRQQQKSLSTAQRDQTPPRKIFHSTLLSIRIDRRRCIAERRHTSTAHREACRRNSQRKTTTRDALAVSTSSRTAMNFQKKRPTKTSDETPRTHMLARTTFDYINYKRIANAPTVSRNSQRATPNDESARRTRATSEHKFDTAKIRLKHDAKAHRNSSLDATRRRRTISPASLDANDRIAERTRRRHTTKRH
jgi:hypothetical protein